MSSSCGAHVLICETIGFTCLLYPFHRLSFRSCFFFLTLDRQNLSSDWPSFSILRWRTTISRDLPKFKQVKLGALETHPPTASTQLRMRMPRLTQLRCSLQPLAWLLSEESTCGNCLHLVWLSYPTLNKRTPRPVGEDPHINYDS